MSNASQLANKFADLYESVMRNRKLMEEGRQAVDHFRRLGLIKDARRTKTGRASYPTYGKKRK
jgi:hypothetical protein